MTPPKKRMYDFRIVEWQVFTPEEQERIYHAAAHVRKLGGQQFRTKADPRAVAGAGTQAGAETNIRVMPGSLILKRAPIGQNSSIVTSATPLIG